MKPILLTTTLLLSIAALAQQNFEGTIIYDGYTSRKENKDSAELVAIFGKNAILLEFRDRKDNKLNPDPEKLLIRLDSGKAYTINTNKRTYRTRRLPLASPPLNYSREKIIAGRKATSRVLSEADAVFLPNYILTNTELVLYISDDLHYAIPEKYKAIPELMVVSNGKIVLGATIRFFNGRLFGGDWNDDDANTEEDETVIIEAREIRPHPVSPDLLTLPVDFTLKKRRSYDDMVAMDSAMIADSIRIVDSIVAASTMSDTMAIAVPDEPIEKKPVKSPPAKPKSKTSSQTSPARKPD